MQAHVQECICVGAPIINITAAFGGENRQGGRKNPKYPPSSSKKNLECPLTQRKIPKITIALWQQHLYVDIYYPHSPSPCSTTLRRACNTAQHTRASHEIIILMKASSGQFGGLHVLLFQGLN
jgi:hypothetical protein